MITTMMHDFFYPTFWTKCCEYNNKDEDNNLKTLNDKNHQASSQKFRQVKSFMQQIYRLKCSKAEQLSLPNRVRKEKRQIHAIPKGINMKGNANSLI